MKNKLLSPSVLVLLIGMHTSQMMAQPEVYYPNPGYWNWEIPCGEELRFVSSFQNSIGFPEQDRHEYDPTGSNTCLVNPFDATGQMKTIYGAALCLFPLGHDWSSERMSPMDRNITLDINVYRFTPGDSIVQKIKGQTFEVEQGQRHDLVMVYKDYTHTTDVVKYPMYEFYFDTPVNVDGHTYIGIQSSDTFLVEYGATYFGRAVLGHTDGSCCFAGYWGFVETKKQMLIAYAPGGPCLGNPHFVGNTISPFGLSAPLTDTTHTAYAQHIMPIIKPRGYLSAAILRDAGDVQLKPNPARTRVTVEADQAIRYVELTDMAGRTMKVQKYDGGTLSATLDITTLPQGLYMVRVRTEKAVTTKKLLIE